MRTIIMANGWGDRWTRKNLLAAGSLPEYKQLLMVGTETVIFRTIRMLKERGVGEVISVVPEALYPQCAATQIVTPARVLEERVPLLRGFIDVNESWGTDRTVILLGDVVFSNKALDLILEDNAPIRFLGRPGGNSITGKEAPELFGLSMREEVYDEVYEHCAAMTSRGAWINYPPKLWALYRLICGFEHDEHKYEDEILLDPEDYTDDIDSPEEYISFWSRLSTAALDDVPVAQAGPR